MVRTANTTMHYISDPLPHTIRATSGKLQKTSCRRQRLVQQVPTCCHHWLEWLNSESEALLTQCFVVLECLLFCTHLSYVTTACPEAQTSTNFPPHYTPLHLHVTSSHLQGKMEASPVRRGRESTEPSANS